MTQKEKQLLLKDLCARLPYGVKILDVPANVVGDLFLVSTTDTVEYEPADETNDDTGSQTLYNIKPYLRPLSSMTKEEREYLSEELGFDENLENEELNDFGSYIYNRVNVLPLFDWLNKKMLDYNGLIPMGLALEAPKDMYKTE